MPILTLSNGLYSNAKKIVDELKTQHGYTIITDDQIIDLTSTKHGIKKSTLYKVIQSKQIAFNDFTHEKEKCIACLKQILSQHLKADNHLFHGMLGHLIPKRISQIMRILIITNKETRIKNGIKLHGSSKKDTIKAINLFDKHAILWTSSIAGKKAFDPSLYDIVIPSDKLSIEESIEFITKQSNKFKNLPEKLIKQEIADFELSAQTEVALAGVGNKLYVDADKGNILITIDKNVMMLSKFKQKISTIAKGIKGVNNVEIKLGKNYYSNTIVRKLEVETPARLLLVDDEKEFVQTLSERLKLRQFPSEIAYNGKQALELSENDDMEVMILDLKMPGIDGFDVLKKIKKTKPHIEVIILTGHGSEQDREKCMQLGAFAYLEKPADIDLLTITMKQAYDKINTKK
jgi:CheY-like chemotaxis protein/cytidylate kinase